MTCTPTCARHCLDPAAPECGSLTDEEVANICKWARYLDSELERVVVREVARGALALAADLARLRASLGTGAGASWEVMASRGPGR